MKNNTKTTANTKTVKAVKSADYAVTTKAKSFLKTKGAYVVFADGTVSFTGA